MIQKFSRFFRKAAPQNRQLAAIYLQPERLKLVLVEAEPRRLLKAETVALTTPEQLVPACLQLTRELPRQTPLCLILSPERYQLLQLDKPALPAAEMLQALPWQIRDLVNIPLDDLVLDYMDLQEHSAQQQPRIQLVASSRSFLGPLCKALQQQQRVEIQSIQPEEWLARNLLSSQSAAVLLLSQQPGQDLAIQIVRDGVLYVSRKLRGFHRLDQYSLSELQHGLLDNLLLEVQRSLDYFEGQLRQPPVKEILLLLATPEQAGIVQYFGQNGFSQVRAMSLAAQMPGFDQAMQTEYWLPFAGALELLQGADREATH